MEELEAWKNDIRIVYSKPVETPNHFFGLPNDLTDHILGFIKYCPYEVIIGDHSNSFETMNEAIAYRDNYISKMIRDFEDLKDYEELYKINRAGQVWSVKRQIFLKPIITIKGYYKLCLWKEGKPKRYLLHRLIALQFLPNPLSLPQIDHIDRDRTNNSLDNLRWISSRGNNLNRAVQPKSGESHIIITRWNTYRVKIKKGKEIHYKTFKTMEEAKSYRDAYLKEHNLV